MDPERVALPDRNDHDRRRDHPAVRLASPVVRYEAGLADLLDVLLERQRGDVSLESADDGASLRSAALVGLLERHVLPGFLFPVLLEGRDDRLCIGFARSGVRPKHERDCTPRGRRAGTARRDQHDSAHERRQTRQAPRGGAVRAASLNDSNPSVHYLYLDATKRLVS